MADDNPGRVERTQSGGSDDTEVSPDASLANILNDYYGGGAGAESAAPADGKAGQLDVADGSDSGASGAPPARQARPARSAGSRATDNMDSEGFRPREYVNGLLRREGIQGLLVEEASIKNQVRNLESDMQMLVYENYNKFISATDMIRKMKANVESMEVEMDKLSGAMATISDKCEHLETAFEPNRAKTENLVGVSRLLHRLEFLFELPPRLNKSIEMKAYAEAVKYYKISDKILQRYGSIASFSKISKDSGKIISRLREILTGLLADPNAKVFSQMEHAGLLLELKEDPESLLKPLFETAESRLRALIEAMGPKRTGSGAAASRPMAELRAGFVAAFTNFAQLYQDVFMDRSKGYSTDQSVDRAGAALTAFSKRVFAPYFGAVSRELERLAAMPRDARSADAGKEFQNGLVAFYQQIVGAASLVSDAGLSHSAAELIERGIRVYVDCVLDKTTARVAATLAQAFQSTAAFVRSENTSFQPLPEDLAQWLDSRADEEAKARAAADDVDARPNEQVNSNADDAKAEEAKAEDIKAKDEKKRGEQGEEKSGDEAEAGKSEGTERLVPKDGIEKADLAGSTDRRSLRVDTGAVGLGSDDSSQGRPLDAEALAETVRVQLEGSLSALLPVLDVGSYLPPALFAGANFGNIARAHLVHITQSTLQLMQCACGVSCGAQSEDGIFDAVPVAALQAVAGSAADNPFDAAQRLQSVPLFQLLLSQTCRVLRQSHVEAVWNRLKAGLARSRASSRAQISIYERELPAVLSRFDAAADALLRAYTRAHGSACKRCFAGAAGVVGESSGGAIPLAPTERRASSLAPSSFVSRVFVQLDRAHAEVSAFFSINSETKSAKKPQSPSGGMGSLGLVAPQLMTSQQKKIELLFHEKVDVLGTVGANRRSLVRAILRMLAKSITECLRQRVLSTQESLQSQLDIGCIRLRARRALAGGSLSGVEGLLDEALSTAVSRTQQKGAAAGSKSAISDSLIEEVYKLRFGQALDASQPGQAARPGFA